jgi:tetratricopeptide (TPR) repeat protein
MKRSFLLVVLLFLFPSEQFRAQTGTVKTQPATGAHKATDAQTNPEAKRLYDDGIERMGMGQISEAVERFQKALNIDPEYVEAYSALGRAFFKLRQWDNASETFRRALALKEKKRENENKRQKNDSRGTVPDVAPTTPASKPKGTSSNSATTTDFNAATQQPKLNKPLPALPINASAVTTLGSALEPLQVSQAELGAPVNIKFDDLPGSPPPATLTTSAIPQSTVGPIPTAVDIPGLREYASYTLVVEGLVQNPGTKSLQREALPLAAVVAEAQPLPEAARVTVVRNRNQILETDLNYTADMRFLVHPGDVVTLHPHINEFLYVVGKVKFPGEKTYRFGLTLMQAIIMAGGTTSNVAEIVRDGDEVVGTRFDLKAIEAGKAADPRVKARDRIVLH